MILHVFGRTFMDLFIFGKDVHNCKIIETPGGSALNASLGFSLLGINTYIHALYGNDRNGDKIKAIIDQYGVKTEYLTRKNQPNNQFIAKNNEALAVNISLSSPLNIPLTIGENDCCLLFATETPQETIKQVFSYPWKSLFIDLGPKYNHQVFPYESCNAMILGNESEAEHNHCDVIKLGKNGAKWHNEYIPGNGQDLPYTTGAGDLFDVVFIYHFLHKKTPIEAIKEAVHVSQKACMIPGSSTKINILRDFYLST